MGNALTDKHLDKAIEFTNSKKYYKAIVEFSKANEWHYGNARIHAEWGLALQQAGRYPEAVEHFQETLKIEPTYPLDSKALSDALNRDVQQSADIAWFQKIVDTANSEALFYLWGQVLAALSHYDEALAQYQRAISEKPDRVFEIDQLRVAFEKSESGDRQLEFFQAAVDKLQNPFAWNTWGKTLVALKKYPSAIENLQKAIQAKSEWAEAYYNCGEAFYHIEDYRSSIKFLQKAVKRDPNYEQAFLLLGRVFNRLELYPKANATFIKAVRQAPSTAYFEPWQKAIQNLSEPANAIKKYLLALEENFPNWKGEYTFYSEAGDFLVKMNMISKGAVQYARSMIGSSKGMDFWLSSQEKSDEKLYEILVASKDANSTLYIIKGIIDSENRPELALKLGAILAKINKDSQAFQQLSSALKILSSPNQEGWPDDELKLLILSFQSPLDRQRVLDDIENLLLQRNIPELWVWWGQFLIRDLGERRTALAAYQRALILSDPWPSKTRWPDPDPIDLFAGALEGSEGQSTILKEIQTEVGRASRAEAFYNWAQILVRLGKKHSAIEQYQQAILIKHDFADAYYRLGQLYADQGRYQEACAQFNEATKHGEDLADIFFEWGEALYKSGQRKEALAKYLLAIKKNSNIFEKFDSERDLLMSDNPKKKEEQDWNGNVLDSFQGVVDEINSAEAYTNWGEVLYRIKHFDDALEQHKRSVRLDPDLEGYKNWTNWQKSIGRAGLSEEHIQEYDGAIDEYRKNAQAFYEWGRFLYNLRRVKLAVERYQKALERDTKYSYAHVEWISCLFDLNDINRAEEEARKLIAYDPENEYGRFSLAWSPYLAGNFSEAVKQGDLGLNKGLRHLYLFRAWAWAKYRTGDEEAALSKLAQRVKDYSYRQYNSDARYEYGNLLLELKRYQEAADQYTELIKRNPNYPYAYHNLASTFYYRGMYKDAWGWWEEALKAYESREPPIERVLDKNQFVEGNEFFYHATILASIKHKLDDAEAILKEGLAFDPGNTLILSGLVDIYWEKKEECTGTRLEDVNQKSEFYNQAMKYFHQAEKLFKQQLDRYSNYNKLFELGNLYLSVEYYEEAKKAFEEAQSVNTEVSKKAQSINAKTTFPQARLGTIHLHQKQHDEAISLFQDVLSKDPYDQDARSNLAEAYLRAEKFEEAENEYRRVLDRVPNHVQSLIGLGEVCVALGEKDSQRLSEAIKYLEKALEVAKIEDIRSKYLRKKEEAAIHYLCGYARVKLYESSGIRRDPHLLEQATDDFEKCRDDDPSHPKVNQALEKLKDQSHYLFPRRLTEVIGPRLMIALTLIVFVAAQITFYVLPFFNKSYVNITDTSLQAISSQAPQDVLQKLEPLKNQSFANEEELLNAVQPLIGSEQLDKLKGLILENTKTVKTLGNLPTIDIGLYTLLTFGSLLFVAVGLYLPQILKLSVGGISLEKSSVDQTQTGGSLGISR